MAGERWRQGPQTAQQPGPYGGQEVGGLPAQQPSRTDEDEYAEGEHGQAGRAGVHGVVVVGDGGGIPRLLRRLKRVVRWQCVVHLRYMVCMWSVV